MSVIIKDMEMPKTCSQCEIWSKCWDERPFWFERLECCPLTEKADRKTEPSVSEKSTGSEKPNNSKDEPQTNADQHVQGVESVGSVDHKTEPTCSKMEQVDKDINVRSKDEPQTCSVNGRPYDCGNCEYFRCTADEPQTERSSE